MVLIVEDDPGHAELMVHCLKGHPLVGRIERVATGEAALDYMFRQGDYADPETSPRPQLVLLDLRLPGIGGLQVLTKIKDCEEFDTIPAVILSTSGDEKDVAIAYKCGANSYLVKLPDYEQLAQLMHEVATYWLSCNVQV